MDYFDALSFATGMLYEAVLFESNMKQSIRLNYCKMPNSPFAYKVIVEIILVQSALALSGEHTCVPKMLK